MELGETNYAIFKNIPMINRGFYFHNHLVVPLPRIPLALYPQSLLAARSE